MTTRKELSLFELNTLVRSTLQGALPDRYWICAEVSEARENYSGHCYLELVDKDTTTGEMRAKARAVIWATVYRMLKAYFAAETGTNIAPGIKLLVEVSIDLHEVYGYTLTIHDIDPRYTLGDMARQRQEILRRLTQEGIIDMNKELTWPLLPRRIAIISSPTAAGYGDFIDQLHRNAYGYRFYTTLFAAAMQGAHAGQSIIEALERIYRHEEHFDGVVIIRGGGATSDLNCFDSYELAQNVAQFPLPILVGIGHDRDETVIDSIANVRVKTPTAAAEWLIGRAAEAHRRACDLQAAISTAIKERLHNESYRVQALGRLLPTLIDRRIVIEKNLLSGLLPRLRQNIDRRMADERQRLALREEIVRLSSPQHILNRGYSLTLKEGKCVRSSQELNPGDHITTFFGEGCSESQIL